MKTLKHKIAVNGDKSDHKESSIELLDEEEFSLLVKKSGIPYSHPFRFKKHKNFEIFR